MEKGGKWGERTGGEKFTPTKNYEKQLASGLSYTQFHK